MNQAALLTVVTSAAVGALVSSLATLLAQALERRSRRRELLLAKSIELAFRRTDLIKELAFKSGQPATFQDDATLAAGYFNALEHLFEHGELPDEFKRRHEESAKRLKEKDAKRRTLLSIRPCCTSWLDTAAPTDAAQSGQDDLGSFRRETQSCPMCRRAFALTFRPCDPSELLGEWQVEGVDPQV
jgi:hypothetical protein